MSGHRPGRRGAFTLVEILIVVGILAVLAAILMVGFTKMGAAARGRTTAQLLGNCRGLLTEYERVTQSKNLPTAAIAAPGRVTEGATDRNGPVTQATRGVMGLLRGLPNNKTAMDQFPTENLWPGTGLEAPIALDGWGNPILFVPAGGMTNVTVSGQVKTISSLDGKPFFASAGPDGSFAAGDDNVYSFDR